VVILVTRNKRRSSYLNTEKQIKKKSNKKIQRFARAENKFYFAVPKGVSS
jgi:hypothetical protein